MSDAEMRPRSADLADLHVFVVPIESWLGKYSVAYNNVALQSTSAGFIRVHQAGTLSTIRDFIKEQLEATVVPNEYVFLRSVGRCMAVVNKNQEQQMRAKHFLPPVAYSPEIFILPGTHEWIASLRGKTKSIIVNKDQLNKDDYGSVSGLNSQGLPSLEIANQNNFNNVIQSTRDEREDESHQKSPENNQTNSQHNFENDTNENTSEMLLERLDTSENQKDFNKSVKRPQSNNWPENRPSSIKDSPRDNSRQNDGNHHFGSHHKSASNEERDNRNDVTQSRDIDRTQGSKRLIVAPTVQVIQPELPTHSMTYGGRAITPTPIPSANIVHSTLNYENLANEDISKYDKYDQSKKDTEVRKSRGKESRDENDSTRERNQNHPAATRDSIEGKQDSNERQRDSTKNPRGSFEKQRDSVTTQRDSIEKQRDTIEEPPDSITKKRDSVEKQHDSIERDDEISPYSSPRDETTDRTSPDLAVNNRYHDELKMKNKNLKQELLKQEELRKLEEERLQLEDKKRNMENETLQLMKGMEELLQKKKEEEEKRRAEEEERQMKIREEVNRKKEQAMKLKEKLSDARKERAAKQKDRETLLREAKELKGEIILRKAPENFQWQRRYEKEKQKTSILEQKLYGVKEELSSHQQKLLKGLEGKGSLGSEDEKPSSRLTFGPSQLNNLKNEARRMLSDIQRLKDDTEKTKGLLEVESKKKSEAKKVLKELRNQVNEKRKVIAAPKLSKNQESSPAKASSIQ